MDNIACGYCGQTNPLTTENPCWNCSELRHQVMEHVNTQANIPEPPATLPSLPTYDDDGYRPCELNAWDC